MPTPGLLVHAAGEFDEGFVVFDAFASQEAFERFGAMVAPTAAEAGIEEPPRSYPLHTCVSV